MDQGIALVLVVLAVLAGGAVVWAVLRTRLRPEAVALISAAAAEIMKQLGTTLDEETVRDLAGALWDQLAADSVYISRQAFQNLVWRAVAEALPMRESVASRTAVARRRVAARTH